MVSVCVAISDPASITSSGKGVLRIQINQLSGVNGPQIVSNLKFYIDGEFHSYFSLSIYLLIFTRLLPVTWDYNQCRSIIGLYYLLHTKMDLNSITADQPGFEPGSLGPKAATLPLCYTPLTVYVLKLIYFQVFNVEA